MGGNMASRVLNVLLEMIEDLERQVWEKDRAIEDLTLGQQRAKGIHQPVQHKTNPRIKPVRETSSEVEPPESNPDLTEDLKALNKFRMNREED